MTVRKPPGVSWESWVEAQIREAMERGDFDNLPGKGKPIADLDRPHDDMRWVREKLRREEVSFTPPTIAVRKELDDTLEQVQRANTEEEVRRLIEAINVRIRYINSHTITGPPTTLAALDVDDVVRQWHASRTEKPD